MFESRSRALHHPVGVTLALATTTLSVALLDSVQVYAAAVPRHVSAAQAHVDNEQIVFVIRNRVGAP